jgi:hypothetical protein
MAMTLDETMKRMKVIEKRMVQNSEEIQKYSGGYSHIKPAFGSEEAQKDEVKRRIQSNVDLMNEYLKLKKILNLTNLVVKVNFNGVSYSLDDLLTMKRKLLALMSRTYSSMDVSNLQRLVHSMKDSESRTPHVVQYFDEKFKNEKLREVQDLIDNIDSRLETINATTPVVDDLTKYNMQ